MDNWSRTQHVTHNIGYGLIQTVSSIILPFIVRTILIFRFGSSYLGLDSLFKSILGILSLSELGFSTAIVFSMYRPAAERDYETLSAYLAYYRKACRWIGITILTIGLLLLPFLPKLVRDPVIPGNLNIHLCYLIFLGDAVIGYLLFGYFTAVPLAFQHRDTISKIDIIANLVKCVLQCSILLISSQFYYFLLSIPFITASKNLLTMAMVRKQYPHLVCRGKLSDEQKNDFKKKVGGLFINKLFITSRNGIDSLCISAFLGLSMTGIYSNYYYIIAGITSICVMVCYSIMPSAGNSIVKESREKNYLDMRRFDFIYMALSGWATTCLLCLYQAFMNIWVGQEMMLGMPEVLGLCLYFYILRMGDIRWVYHEGAGLWWECRYLAIAEAAANVLLNILLCKMLGVLGIITATIISLFFINFLGCPVVLFRSYYRNGKLKEYYSDHLQYALTMAVSAGVSWLICGTLPSPQGVTVQSIGLLVLRLLICTGVSFAVFLVMWRRRQRFADALKWIRAMKLIR